MEDGEQHHDEVRQENEVLQRPLAKDAGERGRDRRRGLGHRTFRAMTGDQQNGEHRSAQRALRALPHPSHERSVYVRQRGTPMGNSACTIHHAE